MKNFAYIITVAALLLSAMSTQAQHIHRVFDYTSPAATEATLAALPDMAALLANTQLTEAEKAALVTSAIGTDREQLAAAAKWLIDQGKIEAAEAVHGVMLDRYMQYAYTDMVFAYLSLKRAERLAQATDNLSRDIRNAELNAAASKFEELAKQLTDNLEQRRTFLYVAGELRYQANQEEMCREDLEKVLQLQPSEEEEQDVRIMLAYFDRADAQMALKENDNVRAAECYERAINAYHQYLYSTPTLPHNTYTTEALDGYLFSLRNYAAFRRMMDGKSTEYARLLKETDHFLTAFPNDINLYRNRRQALYGLALEDSLTYTAPYRKSVDYVLTQRFDENLYSYDDYYEAAVVAYQQADYEANVACLRRAIALYEDPQTTRSQTIDYLYDRMDMSLRIMGRESERAAAQKEYAEVKKSKLGDNYEPYSDYVRTGIRYFEAMKGAEGNDALALKYYLQADTCFQQALLRTEQVDSLRQNNRYVFSTLFDNNNISAINILHTDSALNYVYARTLRFYSDKIAQYSGEEALKPTIDDLQAYSRKMPLAMVAHVADDALRRHYYQLADSQYSEAFANADAKHISEVAENRANLVLNIIKSSADPAERDRYIATLDSTMMSMADALQARPQLREYVGDVLTQHYVAYPKMLGMAQQFADSTAFRQALVEHADSTIARYTTYLPESYKVGFYRGQLYALISTSTQYDDAHIVQYYTEAASCDIYMATPREQLSVQRYLMIHWYYRWADAPAKSEEDRLSGRTLRRYVNAVYDLNPSDGVATQLKNMKQLWSATYDENPNP